MTTIYEQFDKDTKKIGAYALVHQGRHIGQVTTKFPKDGMGSLKFYLHIYGQNMVVGKAKGCGYDKASAAFEDAVSKLCVLDAIDKTNSALAFKLKDKVRKIGGQDWRDFLTFNDVLTFRAI